MVGRNYWPHVQIRSNWSSVSVQLGLYFLDDPDARHEFGGAGATKALFPANL
jgi:hypothetical protein